MAEFKSAQEKYVKIRIGAFSPRAPEQSNVVTNVPYEIVDFVRLLSDHQSGQMLRQAASRSPRHTCGHEGRMGTRADDAVDHNPY